MSRWGKNRNVPSYALPLDALLKEKENTNRPVAARSAGTVGKWGVTNFTSIRARPIYGKCFGGSIIKKKIESPLVSLWGRHLSFEIHLAINLENPYFVQQGCNGKTNRYNAVHIR